MIINSDYHFHFNLCHISQLYSIYLILLQITITNHIIKWNEPIIWTKAQAQHSLSPRFSLPILKIIYLNIMKQRGDALDKISQIICLSNNYLSHKKNLTRVRGLVDHSSPKRNTDISELLSRKCSYRQAINSLNNKQLSRQNQKLVKRLTDISDTRNLSRASARSNQSFKRTLSDQVSVYRTRRNFMKSKQVEEENSRISARIKNAHFKDGLSPRNFQHFKKGNQGYKKVHSRFSERSQDQMQQIFAGLKYDQKKIPFLPILSSRRYSKS